MYLADLLQRAAGGEGEPHPAEQGEQRGPTAEGRPHRVHGQQVPHEDADPDEGQQADQDQPDHLGQVRPGTWTPKISPAANSNSNAQQGHEIARKDLGREIGRHAERGQPQLAIPPDRSFGGDAGPAGQCRHHRSVAGHPDHVEQDEPDLYGPEGDGAVLVRQAEYQEQRERENEGKEEEPPVAQQPQKLVLEVGPVHRVRRRQLQERLFESGAGHFEVAGRRVADQ